jgi:ferredoxin
VDHDACIGSGVCAGTVPNFFRLVNDKSEPIEAEIEPDEEVLDAANSCPMEAIRVIEVASGAVLAPLE